jgi:hypothetical protein
VAVASECFFVLFEPCGEVSSSLFRHTPYYSRGRLVCTLLIVRIYQGWGFYGKVAFL